MLVMIERRVQNVDGEALEQAPRAQEPRLNPAGTAAAALGKSPGLCADDLSLAVRPEVDYHADQVVEGGVGALVEESRGKGSPGENGQPDLDAPVHRGAGDEAGGPFPGQHDQAQHQVDGLQRWYGPDGAVEVGRYEIPKDLWPEVRLDGSRALVSCGAQDNEPGPVVLDKPSHPTLKVGSSYRR